MNIFKNKVFKNLYLSIFLSQMGDSIFYLATIALAGLTSKPALSILLITLSETIPKILFVVYGKMAANSKNKVKMMYVSDIVRFIFYVLLFIILGKTFNDYIFYLIVVVNFLSDSLGKYRESLGLVLLVSNVEKDEMETAVGVEQGGLQIVNIVSLLLGGIFLSVLSYSKLALINAITFFIATMLIFSIRNNTKEDKMSEEKITIKNSLIKLKENKFIFKMIKKYIVTCSLVIALLPVLEIIYLNHQEQLPFNFALSVTVSYLIFSGAMLLGNIFGKFLGISLESCFLFLTITILIFSTVLMFKFNFILVNIVFCGVALFMGATTPKFFTKLIEEFDKKQLPIITGALNSLTGIIFPIVTLFLVSLATVSYIYTLIIIIVLAMCTLFIKIGK